MVRKGKEGEREKKKKGSHSTTQDCFLPCKNASRDERKGGKKKEGGERKYGKGHLFLKFECDLELATI